jgi:hypothetical protein
MMKSRAWKYAALVASGGVVLQLAGCVQTAAQTGLSLLFRAIVSGALGALTGTTATA